MKLSIQSIIFWLLLPSLNFLFWYYWSHTGSHESCAQPGAPLIENNNNAMQSPQQPTIKKIKKIIKKVRSEPCENSSEKNEEISESASTEEPRPVCRHPPISHRHKTQITFQDTFTFEKYRRDRLASLTMDILIKTYTDTDTVLVKLYNEFQHSAEDTPCLTLDHHMADHHRDTCFAIGYVQSSNITFNVARIDLDIDLYGLSISNPDPSQVDKYSNPFPLTIYNKDKYWPQGFFRKVPKENGRKRTKEKLGMFLTHFQTINQEFEAKIASHGLKKGDDVVVMVVNEGELDLFLNFACSCRLHEISLNNILIFAGNPEMIPMVEATGAMGLYHQGYAAVSKRASHEYLDRVFVDMMWYKAFSVYLVLRHGLNVLFQDVDLVWFRDPMPFFHAHRNHSLHVDQEFHREIEGFFSDDGQRSKRYTPFFANSGFYYLVANPRTEYFTWSIMIAMDAIQVLGSHQNVFTTRMLEGLSLSMRNMQLITLEEFPTGIMYHHHRGYMKQLKNKEIHPYHFHMCWTQGKPDKLIYLRKAAMWYLTEECSPLDVMISEPRGGNDYESWERNALRGSPGPLYTYVQDHAYLSIDQQWRLLSQKCCHLMPNAP